MTKNILALIGVITISISAIDLGYAGPLIINDESPIVIKLDTRVRYEFGDQDGLDQSHNGSLRNRLGLGTKEINGFQFFGEYERTAVVDRRSYFVPGVQGTPGKTVIADPESNEINQLWVSYKSDDGTVMIKTGRQAINIDNHRYVGGVAWRQNMQTFDAATLAWKPNSSFEFSYSYVNKVNRIFGSEVFGAPQSDFEGDTHLVNAKYKDFPLGVLTAYAYSMDLENVIGGSTVNSNNSFGLSLAGDFSDSELSYYLEYGHQTEAAQSPLDYSVNYGHGYVQFPVIGNISATAGLEYLGSDNGVGYKFPLATLHKFNGFADQFLVATPATGLTDMYVALSAKLPCDFGAAVFYHHFEDDEFDVEWGNEVDIVLTKKLTSRASLLGKGAFFMGNDTGYADLNRFSLEVNYQY
ncbi:MAG: alginate export family protein [Verrucomicrobiales bacterium]|nr:alginate export family protein [Verrucomicrobiales bacterium]